MCSAIWKAKANAASAVGIRMMKSTSSKRFRCPESARARCQRWLAARRTRAGRQCALVERRKPQCAIDIDIIDDILAWPNGRMIVRMRQRAKAISAELLLVIIIVQLGFVSNRLLRRRAIPRRGVFRSLRTRAEGERRVRRFPASRVARLRVCVHSLGARAHFLLTVSVNAKDAVSSSLRRRMGAHRVSSRPVRREGRHAAPVHASRPIKSVAEIVVKSRSVPPRAE